MLSVLSMKDIQFPDHVLFGAGGAGHQIEGDNIHSQFHEYETTHPEWFPTPAGKACNGWEMYKEDIALFKKNVASHLKIKAAGGIASIKDAEDMITLGATRLGTSRIVKIIKNEESHGY